MTETIFAGASDRQCLHALADLESELDDLSRRRPVLVELPPANDLDAWRAVLCAHAWRLAAEAGTGASTIDDAYIRARIRAEIVQVETHGKLHLQEGFPLMTQTIDEWAEPFGARWERCLQRSAIVLARVATDAIRAGARELQARRAVAEAARTMKPLPPASLLSEALWGAVQKQRWDSRWLNSQRTA